MESCSFDWTVCLVLKGLWVCIFKKNKKNGMDACVLYKALWTFMWVKYCPIFVFVICEKCIHAPTWQSGVSLYIFDGVESCALQTKSTFWLYCCHVFRHTINTCKYVNGASCMVLCSFKAYGEFYCRLFCWLTIASSFFSWPILIMDAVCFIGLSCAFGEYLHELMNHIAFISFLV